MTYDQLITLVNIVSEGSFKAAAEVMHKTQPSLTMAIKKLEEEFGIELFDRSGYRPKLTEQGKVFYQKATRVLERFKELEQLGQELAAGFEPDINICTDAVFPIAKIAHIFEQFFGPYIMTSLHLSTDVLNGVTEKLLNHEVDFALASNIDQNPDIEKIKILETNLLPCISPVHFEKSEKVDLDYIKKLPQIVVQSSVREQHGKIEGAVGENFWYTTDFSMKEQMIAAGLGWGNLPEHLIELQLKAGTLIQVTNIPELKPLKAPMYFMRSKTKFMGPNTKALWKFFLENTEELN